MDFTYQLTLRPFRVAGFNRRMRKTACPVVWEGAGNQSGPDPIRDVLRESLRHVLDEEPDMQIVAEASDGEEAVNFVQNSKANVILMDITMPNMNGIQAKKMNLQHNLTSFCYGKPILSRTT